MSFAKIEQHIANAKPFESKFARRRMSALVLTSLAAFLAMCFLWSLSIKGFTSRGDLVVNGSKNVDANDMLQELVANEMSEDNLSRHILVATEKAGLGNDDLINRRFEKIRDAFSFKIYKNKNAPEYQLKAGFKGRGSKSERVLVKSILHRIAQKLDGSIGAIGSEAIEEQFVIIQDGIEKMSASRHAQLEDAAVGLQHLDADLSVVFEEVTAIRSLPDPDPVAETQPEAASIDPTALSMMKSLATQLEDLIVQRDQMRANDTISIEQINAVDNDIREVRGEIEDLEDSYPNIYAQQQTIPTMNVSYARDGAVDQSLRSIESLNTDTVREKISSVQESIRTDAVKQREQVATLRVMSNERKGQGYTVRAISDVKNIPTSGVPTLAHLLVFGLGALTLGSVVAMKFKPELVDRGFGSVDEAEQTLGLPIVGKLPASANLMNDQESGSFNFANGVVSFCEVALFAAFLVVIFLCLVSSGIREAFFDNPLHGLAQIAWMFLGR